MPTALPAQLQALLPPLRQTHAHALLLHGPSGLGQWALGQALAAAWLCEAPNADGLACGHCAACQLMRAHSHPDCYYLLPETLLLAEDLPLSPKQQKELDEKQRKPSKNISIDAVRDVVAKLQQTSARAQGQVVLVYPAENMGIEAANAFLKTLEEPQGQVRLVLMTTDAHRLLPTIRSRCNSWAMPWPSPEQALAWLQTQAPQSSPAQLETALQATGGRPFDALNWLQHPLAAHWTQLPMQLAQGQAATLLSASPEDALDVLLKLKHDLWCLKVQAPPRYFAAAQLPRPPSATALEAWGQTLGTWARHIQHAWKAELLIEDMVAQTAHMWQS